MKKVLKSLVIVFIVSILFASVGCAKNEDEVVLSLPQSYDVEEGERLIDYMEYLFQKGKLDYEVKDGMVVSINGKENTLNSYWMIYVDLEEYSNTAWGEYEYKNEKLGSATLGVESLPLVSGATYVFVYQTF